MKETSRTYILKGRVQRAGLRARIKDLAKENKLTGFAENLRNYDEDVLVHCVGLEKNTQRFIRSLKKLQEETEERTGEEGGIKRMLSQVNKRIDEKILSEKEKEDSRGIVLLLKRKKALLRDLKNAQKTQQAYTINKIEEKSPEDYRDNIERSGHKEDFVIVRNPGEEQERLDEGIDALTKIKNQATDLHYEIIDTDFSILDIKYGALTQGIEKGFQEFPKAFAVSLEEALDKRYGLRPIQKKN